MTERKPMNVLRQSQLLKVYNDLLNVVKQMLNDKVDPEILASTLVAQGLRLYKGVLDDETFKATMEVIVKNTKEMTIRPLFEPHPPEEKKEEKLN
jgi:hypothetical protein